MPEVRPPKGDERRSRMHYESHCTIFLEKSYYRTTLTAFNAIGNWKPVFVDESLGLS